MTLMDDGPRFPEAKVQLTGGDGNAHVIMAKVRNALRRAGAPGDAIEEFTREAMAGDYDHVLATCMRWADVS
jgi:hypothetical protein